jgi:excisionase family DNA binding protein
MGRDSAAGGWNVNVVLLRPERAAEVLGIGRSKLYELLAAGEIESVRIGRSRRVPVVAIEEYVARLLTEESTRIDVRTDFATNTATNETDMRGRARMAMDEILEILGPTDVVDADGRVLGLCKALIHGFDSRPRLSSTFAGVCAAPRRRVLRPPHAGWSPSVTTATTSDRTGTDPLTVSEQAGGTAVGRGGAGPRRCRRRRAARRGRRRVSGGIAW